MEVNNVTIPVEKRIIFQAEFADLEAFLQKIAGHAMVQIFFGMERFPGGDDPFFIAGKDKVVFQGNTFIRNDPFTIEDRICHIASLMGCKSPVHPHVQNKFCI